MKINNPTVGWHNDYGILASLRSSKNAMVYDENYGNSKTKKQLDSQVQVLQSVSMLCFSQQRHSTQFSRTDEADVLGLNL